MTKQEKGARELLDKLLRNENVSRWDIYNLKAFIRDLIQEEEKYHELENEVEVIIDTAKDSL